MSLPNSNAQDAVAEAIPFPEEQTPLAPPSRVIDLEHPWLGLESFREENRAYFFGRKAEIAEIHLRLRSSPLLILYGRSGLGKTSILNAGLVPRLRAEGQRPIVERLDYKKEEHGPFSQILFALFGEDRGSPVIHSANNKDKITRSEADINAIQASAAFLTPQDVPSRLWLRLHCRNELPAVTHLILDQFEEVFTLGARRPSVEDEVRDALAILLQGAIPEPISRLIAEHDTFLDHFDPDSTPVRVILALRDDYVYALNRWKRHLTTLGQNNFELLALRGPAAFDAVFMPGELRCHYRGEVSEEAKANTSLAPIVTEETARRIVHFAAKERKGVPLEEIEAVPPILSLLCRELNERRFTEHADASGKPAAQIIFHEAETDVETIIATFYERCLDRRPYAVRIFIEEELVSPYSGARLQQDERSILKVFADGCRIPGAADDRRAAGYGGVGAARACLEDLVNQRLLTAVGGGENPGYELVHDLLAAVVEKSRTAREERFQKEQADRRAEAERRAKDDAEARAKAELELRRIQEVRAAENERYAKEQERAAFKARKVASQANVSLARYSEEAGKTGQALAHLAQAVRLNEKNYPAASLMGAILVQSDFVIPATDEMQSDAAIASAEFSADGRCVVTASGDKTARLWDAATGKAVGQPMKHKGAVNSARFSPDGRRVVTASGDKTGRLWDTTKGKAIGRPLRHRGGVSSAQFSPDGRRVVTASEDKTARLWDAATGKALSQPIKHGDQVYFAQFSPDGKCLVTASGDKTARLWDVATRKSIGKAMRHKGGVYTAQFSPDGRRVVTASEDKTARLWDAATGEAVGQPMQHEGEVYSAQFSPDGQRIVTASGDKRARLWDAATGKALGEPMQHEGKVYSAQFSPDGQRVVTVSGDKTARLWDAAVAKAVSQPMQHEGEVYSAQFSPDGKRVVTASGDKRARLWDAIVIKAISQRMQHEGEVHSAQFSPDGKRVVTASMDKRARLWDVATGKPLGQPMQHEGEVHFSEFSPDGERVVTSSVDDTARVWDAATGKALGKAMKHKGEVYTAHFSRDGRRVVTASGDKTARFWDSATGKALGQPVQHEGKVYSVQFSPDGQRAVTASGDRTARLWDMATRKGIGKAMRHKGVVYTVRFSPDGRRVVTASEDKTARLWDSTTGKGIGQPMRHASRVNSAQFSLDGRRVVTASEDKTARLWDAATGEAGCEPLHHPGELYSAQCSPDGRRVVTASRDNASYLWDIPTIGSEETDEDMLLLAQLAEATGGVALDSFRQAEILIVRMPKEVRKIRKKIAAKLAGRTSSLTPLQELLKWSVSDPRTRTISPFSHVTVAEWVKNQIAEGTLDALRAAMQLDPANAPLVAHFGKALAEHALRKGTDRAEARRARGEADFQTRRAVNLDRDNHEVKKLRVEVAELIGSPFLNRGIAPARPRSDR